ncbi:hypothetical protein B0T19DRAFT_410668 [Cercophora scortea]|uniref:Tim44-like domain-containing protein n=1 Tax=Cercophora scortea TaxID=314031 RepID=A0AAE0J4K2_9PEZI|nr:hypothetical protein B0T19DRAFT_410668 [Cercophora scortea]
MAASRIGLRARDMLSTPTTTMTRTMAASTILPAAGWAGLTSAGSRLQTARPISTSQCRERGNLIRNMMKRKATHGPRPGAPTVEASNQSGARSGAALSSASVHMMLPGTFVRPPWSSFPREPRKFLAFTWEMVKARVSDITQRLVITASSKPRLFSRARWKAKNSALLPVAKALHRTFNEALASGDTEALQRVVVGQLLVPLMSGIDSRPKGRRYGWELVRYNNTFRYPRIASHKMLLMGEGPNQPIIRQAVVTIASRQRRVEYDDSPAGKGRVVPGSEKEVDLVENILMTTCINPYTWVQDDWRIFSTVRFTTPEDWAAEREMLKALDAQALAKYKL